MKKILIVYSFLLAFILALPAFSQSSESITITTYYPTAFGSYSELRSQGMAVGPSYIDSNQFPWDDDNDLADNDIPQDANLVVEANVGIGTHQPSGRLHVANNAQTNPTSAIFDDSGELTDSWDNRITFSKNNQELAHFGISGGIDGVNPDLDNFYIDLPSSSQTDFTINSVGNVGLGFSPRQTPRNTEAGSLRVNDVYIRKLNQWVSQISGNLNVYQVVTTNQADPTVGVFTGSATKMDKPVYLILDASEHEIPSDPTIAYPPIIWSNTPFKQTPFALFGNIPSQIQVDLGTLYTSSYCRPLSDSTIGFYGTCYPGFYLLVGEGK